MTNKNVDIEKSRLGKDATIQLLGWLLEYAYHHHRPKLLVAVTETLPEIQEIFQHPDKHLLHLHSFLETFKKYGPLPELFSSSFMLLLNKALVDFVQVHPAIFYSVPRNDIIKLICALRWLLIASTVHDKKFTTSDVKNLLNQFCPVLTETSNEWKTIQNVLSIDQVLKEDNFDPKKTRSSLNLSFSKTRSYWEKRIESTERLASERENDCSRTVLKVFETVKETLWKIGTCISSLLPKTVLEQIQGGLMPSLPDLKYLKCTLKNQDLSDQYLLLMLGGISIDFPEEAMLSIN